METDQYLTDSLEAIVPLITSYGLQVVGALLVLLAGWVLSKWAGNRVQKFTDRSERMDNTLGPIFIKTTRIGIMAITLLVVLGQFGVETASIIAVLGTIGLAIGLALQGTLSNIASGIMLLVLRPFNVGDFVDIGGTMGVVDEIGLFVTEMHTPDNIAVTMPNSRIWGDKIENYTKNNSRRVDMEFGISYNDDLDEAMTLIKDILSNDERILPEPEPLIAVGTLADNSVNILVRPWTQTENVWPLRYDLTKRVKSRFDEEGISFPYPQRDVHVIQENGA